MTHTFTISPENYAFGQWRFLQSQAPAVLMSGGFGSGKTTALMAKLMLLKARNKDTPGLLVSQSYRALWSITHRALRQMLMATFGARAGSRLATPVDKQGACYLDFGDDCPIYLRSATHPGSIDGLDVGWGVGDELRYWPRETYETFLGRVRVPCDLPQSAFSSTPAMGFMADEFNSGKQDRELIIAPTIENAHNLAPGYIDNLRLSYSPRLQKAVIDGYFTVLEGAVYDQLDPDFFNSPWAVDYQYDPNNVTYLGVDPGHRRSAWVFLQETKKNEWVIFDEMMPDDTSDYSCVQMVNDKGYNIDEIWCDPAADATQSAISLDTIAMLQGIRARGDTPIRHITGPFRRIPFGVDKVRTVLGDPSQGQKIRLKFAKSLESKERGKSRGIVKDLLAYQYAETKDGRPVSDVPLKDGITDHSNDALRYTVVGLWLTTSLRQLDPRIAQMTANSKSKGWRLAA